MAQRVEFSEFLGNLPTDPEALKTLVPASQRIELSRLLVRSARYELEHKEPYVEAVFRAYRSGLITPDPGSFSRKDVQAAVVFDKKMGSTMQQRWKVEECIDCRYTKSTEYFGLWLRNPNEYENPDEINELDEMCWPNGLVIKTPEPGEVPNIWGKTEEINDNSHYYKNNYLAFKAAIEVFGQL